MTPTLFETIISTITTLIGSASSGVIKWTGQYLSLVSGNTVLLLFCIALPLVGLGIGVIRRLVRIRA